MTPLVLAVLGLGLLVSSYAMFIIAVMSTDDPYRSWTGVVLEKTFLAGAFVAGGSGCLMLLASVVQLLGAVTGM